MPIPAVLTAAMPRLKAGAIILTVWVVSLGGTGFACFQIGKAHEAKENAREQTRQALVELEAQRLQTARLLKDRTDIDKLAKMLDNRTGQLSRYIQEAIQREQLQAWYAAPANGAELAALYGLPDQALPESARAVRP